MPTKEEFDQTIQEVLPLVQSLIPINWKLKKIESAAHDSEYFDGTMDTATLLPAESEGEIEIYINRGHPRFQTSDKQRFKAEVFAAVGHEFFEAHFYQYTKGLGAGSTQRFIHALDDYVEAWCVMADRVMCDLYKLIKQAESKRKRKKQ